MYFLGFGVYVPVARITDYVAHLCSKKSQNNFYVIGHAFNFYSSSDASDYHDFSLIELDFFDVDPDISMNKIISEAFHYLQQLIRKINSQWLLHNLKRK